MIKAGIVALAGIATYNPEELTVKSFYLQPKKLHENFTGNLHYYESGHPKAGYGIPYMKCRAYCADTIHLTLSNGNKAECWIDDESIMNASLLGFEHDSIEEMEANFEVAEKFAAKYFKINHG